MRKRIKKGVACVLCASMVAALLGGCSSKNAESSKPSIHIESYTKVGYDTVTVQSGDISPILNLKLSPREKYIMQWLFLIRSSMAISRWENRIPDCITSSMQQKWW